MEWITERADVRCAHDGRITQVPSRDWVTIGGARVIVETDPEDRSIGGCPNAGPTIKPCGSTLAVKAGRSMFVRVDGGRVVLSTLDGLTDGTPPGKVRYGVRDPGQAFVRCAA
jgi:hypothetical protein